MVTKCFCFDLKYGYLAYASISVLIRTATLVFLPYVADLTVSEMNPQWSGLGMIMGWLLIAILFCFLAIAGVIQDRSILMFPYIAILFPEIVCSNILMITLSFLINPIFIVGFFFLSGVYSYDLICLISLHNTMRNREVASKHRNKSAEC